MHFWEEYELRTSMKSEHQRCIHYHHLLFSPWCHHYKTTHCFGKKKYSYSLISISLSWLEWSSIFVLIAITTHAWTDTGHKSLGESSRKRDGLVRPYRPSSRLTWAYNRKLFFFCQAKIGSMLRKDTRQFFIPVTCCKNSVEKHAPISRLSVNVVRQLQSYT